MISEEDYKRKFKVPGGDTVPPADLDRDSMFKEAYERAWKCRDFEIERFWQRGLYFWGFILAIGAGYVTLISSENCEKAMEMNIDLYLVELGLIFSVAWLLAIKGSKCWQENWEAHIDVLEDYVSGPLYKTVWYSDKPFYSVSKISEFLAWVVIGAWFLVLLPYLKYFLPDIFPVKSIDYYASIMATSTICIGLLYRGWVRSGYSGEFAPPEGKDYFFDRTEFD